MVQLNSKITSVVQYLRKISLVKWSILITCAVVALSVSMLTIQFYKHLQNQIHQISRTQEEQRKRQTETNQFLLSTVDWASKRQKLILFMTKQITNEWERIGVKPEVELAYSMAEAIEYEAEKYPTIDPLFMIALGCTESAFNQKIVSKAGAIGLFQIMPATGRLLCGSFNMAYSDTLLYNYRINAKFAAKLLEVLYAQYAANNLVLAAYNGGPYQAYYYQNFKDKLSEETRDFIPSVNKKYEVYKKLFETYRVDSTLIASN